jgi:hypothetical protein
VCVLLFYKIIKALNAQGIEFSNRVDGSVGVMLKTNQVAK